MYHLKLEDIFSRYKVDVVNAYHYITGSFQYIAIPEALLSHIQRYKI